MLVSAVSRTVLSTFEPHLRIQFAYSAGTTSIIL